MNIRRLTTLLLLFPAVDATAKDCVVGKPCGETYIEVSDTCHIESSVIKPYYGGAERDLGEPAIVSTTAAWAAQRKRMNDEATTSGTYPRANPYLSNPSTYAWLPPPPAPVDAAAAQDQAYRKQFRASVASAKQYAEDGSPDVALILYRQAMDIPQPVNRTDLDAVERLTVMFNVATLLREQNSSEAPDAFGATFAFCLLLLAQDLTANLRGYVDDIGTDTARALVWDDYPLLAAKRCAMRVYIDEGADVSRALTEQDSVRVFYWYRGWGAGFVENADGTINVGWVASSCLAAK